LLEDDLAVFALDCGRADFPFNGLERVLYVGRAEFRGDAKALGGLAFGNLRVGGGPFGGGSRDFNDLGIQVIHG